MYKVDENDLKDCPIRKNDRVSIVAYFRILLSVILPELVRKVLYLDCDILVLQALENLWAIDIEGYSAGVVMDQRGGDIRFCNNLDYEMSLGYFNSGVMLFNLDYWRENNVTSKVLEYISDNPEKLKLWDQDALNYVLRETKLALPFQYNVQEGFYWDELWIAKKYWAEIYEAAENPVILHYTLCKPWFKECTHPKKELYQKYKSLSPWKNKKMQHVEFRKRMKNVGISLLVKLGLIANRLNYR